MVVACAWILGDGDVHGVGNDGVSLVADHFELRQAADIHQICVDEQCGLAGIARRVVDPLGPGFFGLLRPRPGLVLGGMVVGAAGGVVDG